MTSHKHRKRRARYRSRVAAPDELTDLEVAHELIDRAEAVALHDFTSGVQVQVKYDSTPVTDADRAVEALLRESLSYFRPSGFRVGGRSRPERRRIAGLAD